MLHNWLTRRTSTDWFTLDTVFPQTGSALNQYWTKFTPTNSSTSNTTFHYFPMDWKAVLDQEFISSTSVQRIHENTKLQIVNTQHKNWWQAGGNSHKSKPVLLWNSVFWTKDLSQYTNFLYIFSYNHKIWWLWYMVQLVLQPSHQLHE